MRNTLPRRAGRAPDPTPPREMSEAEIAWLAGLVEGEGCLSINRDKRTSARTGTTYYVCKPVLIIHMTDQDVIEKVKQVTGVGTIRPQHGAKSRNPRYKLSWRYRVHPVATIHLLIRIYPYMRQRRQEKIEQILAEFSVEEPTSRVILASTVEEAA